MIAIFMIWVSSVYPLPGLLRERGGIKERLDMVLVTNNWKEKFNIASVTHLDPSKSDHIPILIAVDGSPAYQRMWEDKIRFRHMGPY